MMRKYIKGEGKGAKVSKKSKINNVNISWREIRKYNKEGITIKQRRNA